VNRFIRFGRGEKEREKGEEQNLVPFSASTANSKSAVSNILAQFAS